MPRMVKSKKGNRQSQAIAALKKSMNGAVSRPRGDPPPVVVQPWYPITVVSAFIEGTGSTVTTSDIGGQLLAQLAFSVPAGFEIRLRVLAIKIWGCLGGSALLRTNDYTQAGENNELAEITDTGTFNSRPSVGYTWPAATSRLPVALSATVTIAFIQTTAVTAVTTGNGIVHTHVQWRVVPLAV